MASAGSPFPTVDPQVLARFGRRHQKLPNKTLDRL